jgi:hypothetical protein
MVGQGGLLQLVAHGKQDVFLTGNPQMTWFKMVYRRYTNFAIESQPMYFDGTPDFGKRITCLVPRRGDLLGQIILEVTLPAITLTNGSAVSYVNSIGHALIQEITVEVGEIEIDKQNGEWMEIWSNYTTTSDKQTAFYNMIGKVDGFSPPTLFGPSKLTFWRPWQATGHIIWAGDYAPLPDPDDIDTHTDQRYLEAIPAEVVIESARNLLS